jgi:hypothetical protein
MDGQRFRFHGDQEFFNTACAVGGRRQTPLRKQSVSRFKRLMVTPAVGSNVSTLNLLTKGVTRNGIDD